MSEGPCAKTVVVCTIISDGGTFTGSNWCRNAQPVCPRLPGEDYTKCRTICDQVGHAEIDALRAAGEHAAGAYAIVKDHTYACQSCHEALFGAGIKWLHVEK